MRAQKKEPEAIWSIVNIATVDTRADQSAIKIGTRTKGTSHIRGSQALKQKTFQIV